MRCEALNISGEFFRAKRMFYPSQATTQAPMAGRSKETMTIDDEQRCWDSTKAYETDFKIQ